MPLKQRIGKVGPEQTAWCDAIEAEDQDMLGAVHLPIMLPVRSFSLQALSQKHSYKSMSFWA
eukprot:1162051-Pelagomonas_calceolata.AAC.5